jgi:hypothetical protein
MEDRNEVSSKKIGHISMLTPSFLVPHLYYIKVMIIGYVKYINYFFEVNVEQTADVATPFS